MRALNSAFLRSPRAFRDSRTASQAAAFSFQTSGRRPASSNSVKGTERGLEQQRGEEGLQPVVVAGGNGVVLVVVAAGATQGHAQEDRTGGPDHVVEDIPAPLRTPVPLHRNPLVEEPGSQLGLVPVVAVGVAGDLFLDEPVVGSILVESPDHVVPVSPQVGAGIVGRLSPGVGVAHQVQPVPAPADAVFGTGEQAFDLPAIGLGGRVPQKALGFLRSGRQADQAEIEAPQAGPVGGGRRRNHPLLFQPGQDEGVHAVFDPGPVAHFGQRRLSQGRPGPGERGLLGPSAGSRRQLVDPLGDGCDVGFRQRTAGQGHAGLLFPLEVLDEGAVAAPPGQHRGTRQGASLEDIRHAFQRQSALAGFAVVAGKAVPAQDRPDLAFESFLRLRWNPGPLAGGGKRQNRKQAGGQQRSKQGVHVAVGTREKTNLVGRVKLPPRA